GELNKVADCLSQYFESDTIDDVHNIYDYVQADKWIDPEGKDLPLHRFHKIAEKKVKIQAMQAQELRRSKRLKEQLDLYNLEAQQMVESTNTPNKGIELSSHDDNPLGDFAQIALMNLANAHNAIIEACVFQTQQANDCRSNDPDIEKGSLVYLSTKNLSLPRGRVSKLCPKWVGLYQVLGANLSTLTYVLELPTALQA
ncbi:hypothetical protein C0995_011535, partial [Termitomyces sp. Mi166